MDLYHAEDDVIIITRQQAKKAAGASTQAQKKSHINKNSKKKDTTQRLEGELLSGAVGDDEYNEAEPPIDPPTAKGKSVPHTVKMNELPSLRNVN